MPADSTDVNKPTTIVPASSEPASAPAAPAASATATPTPAPQPESKPSSPASVAPAPKPGKTKREALIKQLTNSTTDSDVVAKPSSTPETPAEPATAAPAEPATAAPVVESTVSETPGPATESQPAGSTTPAATAPEDLELQDEDPSEVEVKRYSPNAQKRIRQLAGKVRDMQPVADFGHDLLVQLKANDIPPDEFRQWTDLGIRAVKGDPAVGEHLYNMAIRAGFTPPAPAEPQLAVEDAAWIRKQIDDGAITPDAGIALAKKLAKTAAPAQKPAAPRPVPARPQQQSANQINPQAREAAVQTIGARAKAFETQYPADWAKLQPQITAELKKYQGNPPESWPAIFTAVVEKVIAEARRAPTATTTPSLRPGASSAPAVTQFKSERERTIHELSK